MTSKLRSLLGCLLVLAMPVLGCSTTNDAPNVDAFRDRWVTGKGDGTLGFVEDGPVEVGQGAQTLKVSSGIHILRVESYGGTTIDLNVRGSSDDIFPIVYVEGPLAHDGDDDDVLLGDEVLPTTRSRASDDAFRGTYTLERAGVYRVLVEGVDFSSDHSGSTGTVSLDSTCTAACARPHITAKQLLTGLRASGQLDGLLALGDAKLGAMIPDATMRAAITQQLHAIAQSPTFDGLERFPTIPLRAISTVRPLLGGLDAKAPAVDEPIHTRLNQLFGTCDAHRERPPAVNAALPGIGNGHFPNLALTECQVTQSEGLAKLLTALAIGNGSSVTYRGQEYTSPADFFRALLATGHRIEVRNERTYANFISLTQGDVDVQWPVWLDTGIALADGHNLVIPMGHSHHAWRISGPDVNARVMFYLGVSGASFFAQTSVRPAWTGTIARDVTSSETATGADMVVQTVDVAAKYLRRVRVERTTVAAGMPADGYGYIGVCNDSNATIEYATRHTISTFPLVRARELDTRSVLHDGLDEVASALPHDADVAPARADGLRRVLAMTPLALDSQDLVDDALRAQLQAAQAELAGSARRD